MALDLSNTAKRLIGNLASNGGVFFVCYETGGGEDPDTGAPIPGVKSRVSTPGARTNYNLNLIDGVNIKTGDFQLIVPFDTELPDNCWIEDDQYRYSIIGDVQVNHAGTKQISKLQLRRS
ncbi:head-closure protein [Vibrio phage 1.189.B._10N.286.51.B5]|nr:head-closure protein [Vibrio phage 1.189.B._10N.286.51.B5]AUR93902.1 head-closure protein [Vibrio phage 1.189.C._10N.286.51.B5]AUR93968.1 head-closure protein [Vibrio phage 1.189.O._10N.286.51.B5]